MDDEDLLTEFRQLIIGDMAVPVSAMKALESVIRRSEAKTFAELEKSLHSAIRCLKTCSDSDLKGKTNISLDAGCDLFMV